MALLPLEAASTNSKLRSAKPWRYCVSALLRYSVIIGKYLILVNTQVNSQQLASDKALGAKVAEEALLVGMCVFVGDEGCHVDESTATVAALEVSSLA